MHCDIKFQNFCLAEDFQNDGRVFLIDFGLSGRCPRSGTGAFQGTCTKGSPRYLSVLYAVTHCYRFVDDLISLFYSSVELFSKAASAFLEFGSFVEGIQKKLKITFFELGRMSNAPELWFLGRFIDQFISDFRLFDDHAKLLNPNINFDF